MMGFQPKKDAKADLTRFGHTLDCFKADYIVNRREAGKPVTNEQEQAADLKAVSGSRARDQVWNQSFDQQHCYNMRIETSKDSKTGFRDGSQDDSPFLPQVRQMISKGPEWRRKVNQSV